MTMKDFEYLGIQMGDRLALVQKFCPAKFADEKQKSEILSGYLNTVRNQNHQCSNQKTNEGKKNLKRKIKETLK